MRSRRRLCKIDGAVVEGVDLIANATASLQNLGTLLCHHQLPDRRPQTPPAIGAAQVRRTLRQRIQRLQARKILLFRPEFPTRLGYLNRQTVHRTPHEIGEPGPVPINVCCVHQGYFGICVHFTKEGLIGVPYHALIVPDRRLSAVGAVRLRKVGGGGHSDAVVARRRVLVAAAEEEAIDGVAGAVAGGGGVEAGGVSGGVGGERAEDGVEIGLVFAVAGESGV